MTKQAAERIINILKNCGNCDHENTEIRCYLCNNNYNKWSNKKVEKEMKK